MALGSRSSSPLDDLLDPADVGAELLKQRLNDAFLLLQQGGQQMQRQNLRMVRLLGQLLGPDDGFLCFNGKFIESHKVKMARGLSPRTRLPLRQTPGQS